MNASDLAKKMLEWETKRRELDVLESEIKAAVLELGKTQTVGSVRVTYSAGRKKYDYGLAFDDAAVHMEDPALWQTIADTHTKTSIDYRAACKEAGVTDIPFTQGEPSASIKLIG